MEMFRGSRSVNQFARARLSISLQIVPSARTTDSMDLLCEVRIVGIHEQNHVAAGCIDDGVVTAVAPEKSVTIVTSAAFQQVVAGSTVQVVIAGLSQEFIIPLSAIENIVARSTFKPIVLRAAIETIISGASSFY